MMPLLGILMLALGLLLLALGVYGLRRENSAEAQRVTRQRRRRYYDE